MVSIDRLAYTSKLKDVNPIEKVIFAIVTMFFGILLNNIIVSLIIFLVMSFITVFRGKIAFREYYKLILLPMVFLIIGTITIAVCLGQNENYLVNFSILGLKVGSTRESIYEAIQVFLKSISLVTCLYFLTLTTPIVEIMSVLKKFKVPKLFIGIMGLIYRLIFILFEIMNTIYISQKSRLGYSSIKLGYRSLGQLITVLFVRAYKKSHDMYTALESRCYLGEINVIEPEYSVSYKNIIMSICFYIVLIIIQYKINI